MIEHSQTFVELAKALCAAQAEMTSATKDAANPHFKSRYATLDAVIDAVRPAMAKNGLSFIQPPGTLTDEGLPITTMLMHTSGEFMRSTLHVPVVQRTPQGIGSCISYGRRYSLMAILGIAAADDDDGEAAMGRNGNGHQEARFSAPQPPKDSVHPADAYIAKAKEKIATISSEEEGRAWWKKETKARREAGLDQDDVDRLLGALRGRFKELADEADVQADLNEPAAG